MTVLVAALVGLVVALADSAVRRRVRRASTALLVTYGVLAVGFAVPALIAPATAGRGLTPATVAGGFTALALGQAWEVARARSAARGGRVGEGAHPSVPGGR